MDLNTALFLIQDIALVVTIVGWIVTGSQQRTILRETRKYERLDRDLAVYRARMDKASEFTRGLMDAADKWGKLSRLAKALLDEGQASSFQVLSQQTGVYQEAMEAKRLPLQMLYDPQFRTLRDLLPPEIAKKLYDSLKASSSLTIKLIDNTYFMEPGDKNVADGVQQFSTQGLKIADSLVQTADLFADAFAALDRKLAKES
jgi:hypothetical protein